MNCIGFIVILNWKYLSLSYHSSAITFIILSLLNYINGKELETKESFLNRSYFSIRLEAQPT